jgi:hypothetical protein
VCEDSISRIIVRRSNLEESRTEVSQIRDDSNQRKYLSSLIALWAFSGMGGIGGAFTFGFIDNRQLTGLRILCPVAWANKTIAL